MSICAPVSCCCIDTANVKPGEVAPFWIQWGKWLASNPGFSLTGMPSVSIDDLNVNPITPADPTEIEAGSTTIGGAATMTVVTIGANTPLNNMYRMNFLVQAKNCDGVVISRSECLLVKITLCE